MQISSMRELSDWVNGQLFRATHPGKPRFECPICGYAGPFKDFESSAGPRLHALCPRCGSKERHRIQCLAMKQLFGVRDTSRLSMLHFAPERYFRSWFMRSFGRYETADLLKPGVDHQVDLQHLPFPDASYDFVYASHVLEHVPDDRRAIREIRRILTPSGIAVLPVPIAAEKTVEYGAPNPHESGHVRAPGYDYFDRYREVFARVELVRSESLPEIHQVYVYADFTMFPTEACPLRPPMSGTRHADIVPICYA